MGRKPDPKGRDRTRTISLAGDVAEIAQNLADKGQLSRVLSDLLRQSYGISSHISQLEHALGEAINERKNLQKKELRLIEEIDAQKVALIERKNLDLPLLLQQKDALVERASSLNSKLARSFVPTEISRFENQLREVNRLLQEVRENIFEIEAEE
jgi:hypothetical protein